MQQDQKLEPTPVQGCCTGNASRTARCDAPVISGSEPIWAADRSRMQAEAIWLPGADSFIGTDRPVITSDGESPCRPIRVEAFGLDRVAVSNRRFAEFISASGYVTDAERFGWSYVFHHFLRDAELHPTPQGTPWWRAVRGAKWSAPEGPGSTIEGREDFPVTHISWNDASAFAAWAGGRLPTEAEWERAGRAGLHDPRYPWGDDEPDDTTTLCNIWQGRFPVENIATDGWVATAPVASFAPNDLGFYNLVGNVWEWCADSFRVSEPSAAGRARDAAALADSERTQKGGSYLCHASYCHRYRIAARTGRSADTSAGHCGFRMAWDTASCVQAPIG